MARGGFPGGGGGMNMQQMMRQAQQMQQDMQRMQEEMGAQELEVASGGGVVKVTITGGKELKAIKIAPEAVDPDDVEMLEDLVLAAVNEALRKADDLMQQGMSQITGGMNLPGL